MDIEQKVKKELEGTEDLNNYSKWCTGLEIVGVPRGKDPNRHLMKGGTVLVHDKDGGSYELNNKMLTQGAKLYVKQCNSRHTKQLMRNGFAALSNEILDKVIQMAIYKEIRYNQESVAE
ncbi:MAG: hypothetical protein ACLR6B_03425 [Blautia sp.]